MRKLELCLHVLQEVVILQGTRGYLEGNCKTSNKVVSAVSVI